MPAVSAAAELTRPVASPAVLRSRVVESGRRRRPTKHRYLINRKGCKRAVDEFTRPGSRGAHYKLPGGVQLVSDVLMYNGPGAYTYTRPLYDHEIKESTIHQGHVESCHRQAAELSAAFYDRMDTVWAGGDDGRAAVACVLRELCTAESRERLKWWVAFHLRAGFRWLFLYVAEDAPTSTKNADAVAAEVAAECKWIGKGVVVRAAPPGGDDATAADATARARLAGASWLLRLAEHELLYVVPGRSLRSVFDEARRARPAGNERGRGNGDGGSGVFNVRFDSLEAQRRTAVGAPGALDSRYNFFAKETLFKRRADHADGQAASPADDRAHDDGAESKRACCFEWCDRRREDDANALQKSSRTVFELGARRAGITTSRRRSRRRVAYRGKAPLGPRRRRSSPRRGADRPVASRSPGSRRTAARAGAPRAASPRPAGATSCPRGPLSSRFRTGGRAEIVSVGPDFATCFERTTQAVQRCKNEQQTVVSRPRSDRAPAGTATSTRGAARSRRRGRRAEPKPFGSDDVRQEDDDAARTP